MRGSLGNRTRNDGAPRWAILTREMNGRSNDRTVFLPQAEKNRPPESYRSQWATRSPTGQVRMTIPPGRVRALAPKICTICVTILSVSVVGNRAVRRRWPISWFMRTIRPRR
jgi:hypothetical protein